jgi:hypothetical protein
MSDRKQVRRELQGIGCLPVIVAQANYQRMPALVGDTMSLEVVGVEIRASPTIEQMVTARTILPISSPLRDRT